MEIGQWIREQRKLRNFSLEELEKASSVSRSTISRIERNETPATWDNIVSIVKGLGLSMEEVLTSKRFNWFVESEPRSFYGSLAPKLQNIGCRLDDDISEGYIWLSTEDGVFEPTLEEIEKLDEDSDNYLRYRIYQLITENPDRFRKKK